MKTLQIPGQFIYEAFVIPPRKRTEQRMWLRGTTVYEIASVTRGEDAIGEMRFTIGSRADMSAEELSQLRRVKLVEYGGRLWKQGSYEPLGIENYARMLSNWTTREGGFTDVEMIMSDPVVTDPIFNSVAPRQRAQWPRSRFDRLASDTGHIGRITRSDRKACEARYQAAAGDVLFVDGVLHYPAPAPVWQCYMDDDAPLIELEELDFARAHVSDSQKHTPQPPVGHGIGWMSAFAVDRLQDAVALHAVDVPERAPSIRGTVDAIPAGYVPVPPLAYCISEALDAKMLEPLTKLTHLLSPGAFASWKRLTDAECDRGRFALGRLAQDPRAAAEDVLLICRDIEGHFLSEADEDACELFRYHARRTLYRLEFEKSRETALLEDAAIASLAS